MKQQEPVDSIFKQQLQNLHTGQEELLWQQLAKQLRAEKRKKRVGLLWICLVLLTGLLGSLAWNILNTGSPASPLSSSSTFEEVKIIERANAQIQNRNVVETAIGQLSGQQTAVDIQSPSENTIKKNQRKSFQHKGKMSATASVPDAADEGMESPNLETSPIVIMVEKQMQYPSLLAIDKQRLKQLLPIPVNDSLPKLANQPHQERNGKPWHVQMVAGTDLFGKNNQVGYQLGFRFNKALKNGAEWSIGLQYASTQLSNKYQIANKPAQQTGIDAELNNLAMVQLPIVFQQRFNRSGFYGRVGLAPIYIVSASIYNLPNNYTGSPFQYRQFTINDIHPLNILFTAGLGFKWHPRWALELNGTYGMTELVKNSYINQSRVDGSLKNIQATLVFQLK